ncbi:DnaA ATPase domain-containing protein [Thermosulfurimonas sp. F29]|uniref:DnaA ATPase domain-containing protein n=1 Tax=Thermosulfurimonas sp. F29 TaxID=2867247 RepID=UPI001C83BC35|nr:DnaA/Hda family protein [Thermosulfurimonas sp. F29]MBX6424214.1 ATP-binding protein [Thermosulfurimonas sp. F29]
MGEEVRVNLGSLHPMLIGAKVEVEDACAVVRVPGAFVLEILQDHPEVSTGVERLLRAEGYRVRNVVFLPGEAAPPPPPDDLRLEEEPSSLRPTGRVFTFRNQTLPVGYTWDRYVVSEFNRDAFEAVVDVTRTVVKRGRADRLSSYTVYSESGMGKTHLVIAAAWEALLSGRNVAYFPGDRLRAFLIEEVLAGKTRLNRLLDPSPNIHLVIIDDLQALMYHVSRRMTGVLCNMLFSIIDTYLNRGIPVLVTTDTPFEHPLYREVPLRVLDRMRLRGFYEIKNRLDPPFVDAYLDTVSETEGVIFEEDLREFLRENLNIRFRNVRQVVSFVEMLVARASSNARERTVTLADARNLCSHYSGQDALEALFRQTLAFLGLSDEDGRTILGSQRVKRRDYNRALNLFCAAAHLRGHSLSEIASFLGKSRESVHARVRKGRNERLLRFLTGENRGGE